MKVLLAVFEDLLRFALPFLFKSKQESKDPSNKYQSRIKWTEEVHDRHKDESAGTPTDDIGNHTVISIPKSLGTSIYIGVPDTLMYADPIMVFDGVMETLSYGELVTLIENKGRWSRIRRKESEGWVLRDTLEEMKTSIHPSFTHGKKYDAEDPETVMLRTILGDMFFAMPLELPLQDIEYVSYILKKKGRDILWPLLRPRTSGTWHVLLKGVEGIHIGVTPKTDSILEIIEDDIGHVAYVDAVFPDESIKISEIGYPEEGMYSERTLPREEWREHRPVFIEVG